MSGRLSDYDYTLPPERIAQRPLEDRAASRLLVLDRHTGEIAHQQFRDLPQWLESGDLLVMNATRVTAMRLHGRRTSGGAVELLLVRETAPLVFEALAKPARKLRLGDRLQFGELEAEVIEVVDDQHRVVSFVHDPDARAKLDALGETPLPPYIHERLDQPERYQTVFARKGGSAAAPTAGLHFTSDMLEALRGRGVRTAEVTLDVGIDTFRPMTSEVVEEHRMHGERCAVPEETAAAIHAAPGRIVAVGTTTVRTLESFASGRRRVGTGQKVTDLFIQPGYPFQVVDAMLTNFHMPRTSLLVMISAFAGRERVLRAYEEALREGYRFLSFGDAMFIK